MIFLRVFLTMNLTNSLSSELIQVCLKFKPLAASGFTEYISIKIEMHV